MAQRISIIVGLLCVAMFFFSLGESEFEREEPSAVVVNRDSGTNETWWKNAIIYQIYPRSFKDSDGDGVGDIKGIITKLDYFTYLGVDCIWLSPAYTSPMVDFGYDVADYKDIDPIFGTIDDFRQLVKETHKRGLKIIIDFVPGHTSTEHVWFKKSVNRDGKYTNYYRWDDGIILSNGTRSPPNNWLSVFGGAAWAWNTERQQYYYHAFVPEQANLNYRDENVQWEMKNVLRFWLDQGVDGFRIDAISQIYQVENTSLNEPVSGLNLSSFQYEYLNHIYTADQPEIIPTVTSWNKVLEEYTQKDGNDRYMVIEIYDEPKVRNQLYQTGGNPFNFDLINISPKPTGYEIRDTVLREYINLPTGKWPNFVLGNHDRRRVSHKYGPEYVDVYNMMLLTLWGSPTTYYGEELGMLEGVVSWEETIDPWGLNYGKERYKEFSRDPERTPMQWTAGYQAGFTTGNTTWLPLGVNYTQYNVETEKMSSSKTSIQLYKQLASLRKKEAFESSNFKVDVVTDNIFSYIREGSTESYLVAMNFGRTASAIATSNDREATTVAVTPGLSTDIKEQETTQLSSVILKPGDGIVFKLMQSDPVIG